MYHFKFMLLIFLQQCNDCVVTVAIELGHQADFLPEPEPNGFSHKWTVFVRGFEGSKLEHYVERVVFHLHKTFKMPKRSKIFDFIR